MIISNNTAAQKVYTHQTTTSKNEASKFDKALKNEQLGEIQKTKTEEIKFKKIERMSFEFIKNLTNKDIKKIYSDLPREERSKISNLNQLANLSENEVLNKTLFDKAKDMTPKEARSFGFEKASEQYHYKTTGSGQRFIINSNMFIQGSDGKYSINENMKQLTPDEYKLSHDEAFNMILDMIKSSEEGMKKTGNSELKELYENTLNDYTDILNRYNNQLRNNLHEL